MKRVSLWLLRIGLFISVGLITVPQGHPASPQGNSDAQDEDTITCTLNTLKGRYLFTTHATYFPPAFGVTEPTPAAIAGFRRFNGDGTGTDIVTVRLGGVTVLENEVVPFSYTVNADCTGSLTVIDGPSFGLFLAPNGESLAIISTAPPGLQASEMARRVSRK